MVRIEVMLDGGMAPIETDLSDAMQAATQFCQNHSIYNQNCATQIYEMILDQAAATAPEQQDAAAKQKAEQQIQADAQAKSIVSSSNVTSSGRYSSCVASLTSASGSW